LVPNAVAGTTTLTLPTSSGTIALLANNLGSFAPTTSEELLSVISDESGSGQLVFSNSPTLTTPTISTSIKSNSSTFSIVPETVTTLNVGGSDLTDLTIGANTTTSQTVNIATGATTTGNTKSIFIGTGGLSGSTTNVTIGSNTGAGTLQINSPSVSFSGNMNVDGSVTGNTATFVSSATSRTFNSTVATGTAPFVVNSTTRVANLNVAAADVADRLTTPRTISLSGAVTGSVSFNGSSNVNIVTSVTGSITPSSIVTTQQGALSGFRNRITNGDAVSSIVYPTSTITAGNSGFSGPARWKIVLNNITGLAITQTSIINTNATTTPVGGIKQAVSSAGPASIGATQYYPGIHQVIESVNCVDLSQKTITVSFYFRSSVSGTYALAIGQHSDASNANPSFSYVTTFTIAVGQGTTFPTRIVKTIPAGGITQIASANGNKGISIYIGAIAGSNFVAAADTWTNTFAVSTANATNWAATASAVIEAYNIQLEEGPVATPFEKRTVSAENLLVNRYVVITTRPVSFLGYSPNANGIAYMNYHFPTPMRIAPTPTSNFTVSANTTGSFLDVGVDGMTLSAVRTDAAASISATYNTGNIISAEF
jgi:hypothetical protein